VAHDFLPGLMAGLLSLPFGFAVLHLLFRDDEYPGDSVVKPFCFCIAGKVGAGSRSSPNESIRKDRLGWQLQ
jgi:hypothetical protein